MPTILLVQGWRFFFYMNEGNEPVPIHCHKGDAECKYWLRPELYEIEEAWSYNLSPRLRREVRKIIFDHFDLIVEAWEKQFRGRRDAND
ncbi:MAG: DUF4160 domain-containing protein [Acidobacteriota bacterium]